MSSCHTKRYRAEAKAAGNCVQCYHRRALEDRVRCFACLESANAYQAGRREQVRNDKRSAAGRLAAAMEET